MAEIQSAVEAFIEKRLAVYSADPQDIVRNTRAAERAARDHAGRWLFELLQNCDDAGASEVRVLVKDDAVYVADNGSGLKPEAISAICGTDFSDKTSGTIGRKGIGFKSIYEVSRDAQVITVKGEGIEFNHDKAKTWLQKHGLADGYVPYQWIPFAVLWDEAILDDPNLEALAEYKTIVKLATPINIKAIRQVLNAWPPHALFTFRHVRKIFAPNLSIELIPDGQMWELRDSRCKTPAQWRVSIHHIPASLVPESILRTLGTDERKSILEDGVSFRIAAPVAVDRVVPTAEYLPIHVYYPTEQTGPVRLLLHSEFLVKSDRTALIPLEDGTLNEWIAERLAFYVCEYVNDAYDPEKQSSNIALLVPFGDRASHPVAERLWDFMALKAKAMIRLANVDRKQHLSVSSARLTSVSIQPELARLILEKTNSRRCLLDPSYDGDREASKALRELGCGEIHDHDLIASIAENAAENAENTQWIWACWQWLAEWAAKEPYGEKHAERITTVKKLPIVPVEGRLTCPEELAGRIVTWRSEGQSKNLPRWLPLTFVDDWLRDRIQTSPEKGPSAQKLCAELDIRVPKESTIQLAVGRAIEHYWKDRQDDPERFLRFILEQDWHETSKASDELQRCPVALTHPVNGDVWTEARKAYFGRDWGNELLAEVYNGIETVAWVRKDAKAADNEKTREVLEWLGVYNCPRIVCEAGETSIWQLGAECGAWKKYLESAKDSLGRDARRVSAVTRLEHLSLEKLNRANPVSLISLIFKNWELYYRKTTDIYALGTLPQERSYRYWYVKAWWWWEVCEKLALPRKDAHAAHVALKALWVPDKRTERSVGDLLHIIDLDAFGSHKNSIREWLLNEVKLRSRTEQLKVAEWKDILTKIIPRVAPAAQGLDDEKLRDKVTKWYEACLESTGEQDDIPNGAFASCPILCRKGDSWRYVVDKLRYLNDDNDIAKAFSEDIWLFHLPLRLTGDAAKYFNIRHLTKFVQVSILPGEATSPLSGALQDHYLKSLPYIWAWRSSQSKQDAEKLTAILKKMEVYLSDILKATLTLDGLSHDAEKRWHADGEKIYLLGDSANEAVLAQALAKAIDVRTEADFYENLLRCNTDEQRKEKLLSKGMVEAEVERLLREYSGQTWEPGDKTPSDKKTGGGPPHIIGDRSQVVPDGAAPAGGGKTPQTPTATKEPQVVREKILCLKDFRTVEYSIGVHSRSGSETGGGSGGSGAGQYEGQALTDEEKKQLEDAGRHIATRELTRLGYAVEMMPRENPGFDLRATRSNEELRVEVKAHKGRATIVDVTNREYKEYLGQEQYKWELWNVEHLAADDTENVIYTRYDELPDDALDTRTFRVDLKKCHSPSHEQTEN